MSKTTYTLPLVDEVHDLIEDVCDDVGYDAYFHSVDPISAESYSGFIAFTDGGWDGVVTFGFYGEQAYSSDIIRPFVDRDWSDMNQQFRQENDLDDEVELNDYTPGYERFREDWEQGDESEWFVKVRAIFFDPSNTRNATGEPEWLFCIGVCDDFGYGRDHVGAWAGNTGTHWQWEETVKVSDLTPEKLASIATTMKEVKL